MAACEKCWADAYLRTLSDPSQTQLDHYFDLMDERYNSPCSPEEQAGVNAGFCEKCKRKTVHQETHECLLCEWSK